METKVAQFQVKHTQFEGPIEVLLELIEKRKLFVNDVSLASVTDDFIHYIQTNGTHPDMVASFLQVAATLILIKARSLLPSLELTTEESTSISDLERRLALYQLVSKVAGELSKQYGKKVLFGGVGQKVVVFAPDPVLRATSLPGLINGLVARMPTPAPAKPETRVQVTISITEVIDTIRERIERMMSRTNFADIIVQSPDGDSKSQKVYTIVSFLGMLELVRRGFVAADQDDQFGDITLDRPHTS